MVAVAPCPLEKGIICNVDGQEITLIEDIAQRHKFTLKDIKKKQPIIKYGYPIGIAKDIRKLLSHQESLSMPISTPGPLCCMIEKITISQINTKCRL